MSALTPWQALPHAGTVDAGTVVRPETGSWRTGLKPQVELASCATVHCSVASGLTPSPSGSSTLMSLTLPSGTSKAPVLSSKAVMPKLGCPAAWV